MGSTSHDQQIPEIVKENVPQYEGYVEQKSRRKSDVLLRTYLQEQLVAMADALSRCVDRIREKTGAIICENLAKIEKKLRTIAESVSNPMYTHAQFFEDAEISPDLLSNLYSHEIIMFTEAGNLSEEIEDLMPDNLLEADLKERIIRLDDAIDAFNQALFERDMLLEGNDDET